MFSIDRLFKSEYFKNVSTQVLGIGLAQIIPLLVSPFLARIYDKSDFGNLTFFMSVVAVMVVPVAGRYHLAIIGANSDDEAESLSDLSILLTLLYSLILLIGIAVFYNFLEGLYSLNYLWYFTPLYVFIYGVNIILINYSIRRKKFFTNAKAKVTNTFTSAIISFSLGVFNRLYEGLIVGKVFGLFASILVLREKLFYFKKRSSLVIVAKDNIAYPKLTILPSILDIFSLQSFVFFVGLSYSEETLGYVGLTNILMAAPISLLGIAIRDVFYQKGTIFFHNSKFHDLRKLFFGSFLFLFFIGVLFSILMFFFAENIFVFIYGMDWLSSGKYGGILVFATAIKLAISPLSVIFNITKKLGLVSLWQLIYFISTIVTFYIVITFFDVTIIEFIWIYVVHEIILYLIYFCFQLKVLNFSKIKN